MKKIFLEVKAAAKEHDDIPDADVPCHTINCVECCVKLSPYLTTEEIASGKYIYSFFNDDDPDVPVICIPRTDRGCVYLHEGSCTIYDDRPQSCRKFDCRKGHSKTVKNQFVEESTVEDKLYVSLGAGFKKREGIVTVDYDASTEPDYCLNIETERLPFEDSTVDGVIAHHILEHLGEGYFHALQEVYRVCKHGAIIDVVVPYHNHDYFKDDPTHRRPITVGGLWLFSKKYNDLSKAQGAAASRLGYFFDVDFEVVDVFNIPSERYIKLFEGKPVEEVEAYMREHNNIIEQVNIKLVVVKEYA